MWGVLRLVLLIAFALTAIVAILLRWGGYLLISDAPLPAHVDGAVVLQGSVLGEKARIAGAVRLVQQGITPQILVSVPTESYWGSPSLLSHMPTMKNSTVKKWLAVSFSVKRIWKWIQPRKNPRC